MGNRRTAVPGPAVSVVSIEQRLAPVPAPQWAQTGAQGSTADGSFGNISVTGTATIVNLAVTGSSAASFAGSTLRSMAFQFSTAPTMSNALILGGSATGLSISGSTWTGGAVTAASISSAALSGGSATGLVISGSSWASGPVASTALTSTAAAIVAVNSSWQSGPVASTALSSTNAALVLVNSSWQSGPVTSTAVNLSGGLVSGCSATGLVVSGSSITGTPVGLTNPSTGKFSEFSATGALKFGIATTAAALVTAGYVEIESATGGTIHLAIVAT